VESRILEIKMKGMLKNTIMFSTLMTVGLFFGGEKAKAYVDGCTVSFQVDNEQYIVAEEGGGGAVNANRSAIGVWEQFVVTNVNAGRVTLRTHNGNYLSATNGGGSTFNALPSGAGDWEKFTIVSAGGGRYALRTDNDTHYVVAEDGGGGIVNANRTAIGGWESFAIIEGSGCTPPPPPNPTCGAATPDGDWAINASVSRVTSVASVANATQVRFRAYGAGADIWYDGVNQGGGVWNASIVLTSFTGTGTVAVDVYAYNSIDAQVYCDSANFIKLNMGTIEVNSNVPTTWSITCPLTNPACPNVTTGSNASAGTYTEKPDTTWTITPANIAGYTWKVNSCAVNTACPGNF